MQICYIAGSVGKDAVFKTTQNGKDFASFSVAVSTGWGENKQTTWWDVTKWGQGAQKLADMLVKGTKVAVSGEVSTREHDGRTYLQIRADHVTLQGGRSGGMSNERPGGYGASGGGYGQRNDGPRAQNQDGFGGNRSPRGGGSMQGAFGGELDDELPPFVTMGGIW